MRESKELLKELLRQLEDEEQDRNAGPETAPAPVVAYDYLHTSMEERLAVALEMLADKVQREDAAYQDDELAHKLVQKRKEAPAWVAAQPLKKEQ